MIPAYRDEAVVIEAAKTVQFGQELPMDTEVLPPTAGTEKQLLSHCHSASRAVFPTVQEPGRGGMGLTPPGRAPQSAVTDGTCLN